MAQDKRIFSPAAARNKNAVLETLKDRLPKNGVLLEIASGTGEHAAHLAPHFPDLLWQPSNLDAEQLESAHAWREHSEAENILLPVQLDATASTWPVEEQSYEHGPVRAIFNANMIHISPWLVCQGLMIGAGRVLESGGHLFMYGPYKIDGAHTSASNEDFEQWLLAKDGRFGVRDIAHVIAEAENSALRHLESIPMPANNFIQVFRKD